MYYSFSISWGEGVEYLGLAPMLLLLLSGLLLAAVSLGFIVSLGLWVYNDAKERTDQPALWTLIVLFVPSFIGLIIYLLAGRDKTTQSSGCYKNPLLIFAICFAAALAFFIGSLVYFFVAFVGSELVTQWPAWLPRWW